ncbi:MAG: hypothetical protein AAGH19_05600 [Pseudomonadota bacterium]
MTPPRLGPANAATLVTANLDECTAIYGAYLDLHAGPVGALSETSAGELGWPSLAGTRSTWLANAIGEPWLRVIEAPNARQTRPFELYGWLSLEIAVKDVDALGTRLADSPFDIIGPPADLAMSDAIRAMQVIGPCGEVLYLTQVKRPLPPFELPQARCSVDRLFIPVMMTPDREASLEHYSALSGNEGLRFETQITVISAARGLERDHAHPVATLQLTGETLIEIDEVAGLNAPPDSDLPPTGIALIHFQHPDATPGVHTGPAGERYLIQTH